MRIIDDDDDEFEVEEYQVKRPKNVSISSEKSLAQFVADSPRTYHSMLQDLFTSNLSVNTKLSDVFKKATPIILIFGIVMIVALIMGNAPMIVDSVAKYTGTTNKVVTETRIVYLNEDEARAQGMDVPPNPNAPDPSPIVTCPADMELRVTEASPEGECMLKEVPPEIEVDPSEATNPRMEGFDIVGNLLPKVQTDGFLPPPRTGDQDVLREQELLRQQNATATNSTATP